MSELQLPGEPLTGATNELPSLPERMDDARTITRWRDAIVQLSEARGQARAILDVLKRRGVPVSDDEAERILACRDLEVLTRWLASALSVASVTELVGKE